MTSLSEAGPSAWNLHRVAWMLLYIVLDCACQTKPSPSLFSPKPGKRGKMVTINCDYKRVQQVFESQQKGQLNVYEISSVTIGIEKTTTTFTVKPTLTQPSLPSMERHLFSLTFGPKSQKSRGENLATFLKAHVLIARCQDEKIISTCRVNLTSNGKEYGPQVTEHLQIIGQERIVTSVTPVKNWYEESEHVEFRCSALVLNGTKVNWYTGRACTAFGYTLDDHNMDTRKLQQQQHTKPFTSWVTDVKDECPNMYNMSAMITMTTTAEVCLVRCAFTQPSMDVKGSEVVWTHDFRTKVRGAVQGPLPPGTKHYGNASSRGDNDNGGNDDDDVHIRPQIFLIILVVGLGFLALISAVLAVLYWKRKKKAGEAEPEGDAKTETTMDASMLHTALSESTMANSAEAGSSVDTESDYSGSSDIS